ncbi:MAG: DNA-directed RNA polymerase subunit G [Desulfurococcaceae archaeon]
MFECNVSEITPLRIPRVYRVKSICSDVDFEIELHEEVIEAPKVNSKVIFEITSSRDNCLKHNFCAHGYVVSNIQLGDVYRTIISLHGFLVVVKSKQRLELNEMDHVYLGASFAT